jgi:hypothetical protein
MYTEIKIFIEPVPMETVKQMAEATHGDFVKGVVDLEKKLLGLGGDMHSDIEQLMLERGSKQQNLWGINLYPDKPFPDFLEFDSMINIRPRQNNRSRGVDDPKVREQITKLVTDLVK